MKIVKIVLAIFIFALVFNGCGSSDGGGDAGPDTSGPLQVPEDAAASKRIGTAGGEIEVVDEATGAKGVKLVVPAGAISGGGTADFYVRVVDTEGAVQIEPSALDAARAGIQYGEIKDGLVIHPLYAALLNRSTDLHHVGPVLEFGPENVTFGEPIEIHIPFDKGQVAEDEAQYMTVLSGNYDMGMSSFEGNRETDITVDYAAGVIVVKTTHLSLWQAVKNIWGGTERRIAGLLTRPFVDLPYTPSLTQAMGESITCSGYKPHIDISRLPDPLYFLYYLASPMEAESRVLDPVQHALDRQFYENKRVVVGHEVPLEDWVLAQPKDSVTSEAVFAEAYKMVQGDVFQALLLTHNVFRGFDGANRYGDVRGNAIQERMTDLVGIGGDEVGMRYHYFGMASFGFLTRVYGNFSQEFYAGLEIPFVDMDEEMNSAIIYLEECLISGDCITEPNEYAVDIRGRETGMDLADKLFDNFTMNGGKFEGTSLNDVAQRFGVDVETCISVDIQGDREYTLGEYTSLNLVMTNGTGTPGVEWFFQGDLLMTGPEFFYQFDQVGDYTLRVTVTDESMLELTTSVTVTVTDEPDVASEYVIYYTDNVRCWGGAWLIITDRQTFNTWRATASYDGGGIDWNEEAIKVEVQGGFETSKEASDWLCPRITGWHFSYWCGGTRAHYLVSGQTLDFRLGGLDCDLSGVPEVPYPDPHP